MYTRRDQIEMVKSIRLKDNERLSIDCPFCGGRKKFSITRVDGKVIWNCYRASCSARGAYGDTRSITESRSKLVGTTNVYTRTINPIPAILSSVDNHPPAVKYLKSVNSFEAYCRGLIKIKYDPRTNRVLFFNRRGDGAAARALDDRLPKWFTFGNTDGGIIVGEGSCAVVVEDSASACSVSRIDGLTGIALLGTSLSRSIKAHLLKYNSVVIVLDNDASSNAITIGSQMSLDKCAKVRFTNRDLKWLKQSEIREIIR